MFKSKNIMKFLLVLLIVPVIIGIFMQVTYTEVKSTEKSRTVIHFWNSMSGKTKVALDKLVNNYNQSQDKYFVISDFEGAYGDSLAKYLSIAGTASAPTIMQVFDLGTQVMRDSKSFVPVEEFIQKDGYDKSQLEPRISKYYSVDGKQQSMPFNTSSPVFYYNKDILKSVGFNKAPETYEDILEIADRLVAKGGKAKAMGVAVYGWYYEEMLANQGALNMNQDNGQTGLPTESLANSKAAYNYLNWLQSLIKKNGAINYGVSEDIETTGFLKGDIASMFGSSASSADILAKAKFNVGIAYLPHPQATERAGIAIGGASLYITKGKSAEETAGAWDFLKFASSSPQQSAWALGTGYFPVNVNSYKEKDLLARYQKFPEMENGPKQLQTSKDIPATSGFFSDSNVMARATLEAAMEEVYNGGDIQTAMDKAVAIINKDLVLQKEAQKI